MGLETAGLATVFSGLGMASAISGQYQQSKQQAAQANMQAQIAANNATIAEQNAREAVAAGKAEEQRQRIANNQRLGKMRAQFGASGVDLGTGSALDATADQAMMGEADALTSRNQWQQQENSLLQQANRLRNTSSAYDFSARAAKRNGAWKTGTSLLDGAGWVAGKWGS